MKLNLGCGADFRNGYVNHDRTKRPGVDVAHDLDVLPWPWKDSLAQEIRAWAVLEHLRLTLAEAIQECWRILQVGGLLIFKVPVFGARNAAIDPTHVWRVGYCRETFDFFDPTRGEFGQRGALYGLSPWQIIDLRKVAQGQAWSVRMEKCNF